MKLSPSRARESIWVWLLWSLGIHLALELGAFRLAAQVLNKTAGELAGPYFAFAVPWAIFAPLTWWLWKWDEQGVPPKRLARRWGLNMTLFGVAVLVATFYSGKVLHLMDPAYVVGAFITTTVLAVPIFYFGTYYRMLEMIAARAGKQVPCDDESDPRN
jgi:hypothetical protein